MLTDNVESQVGCELAQTEFLARLDVFVQMIEEALRLFQHGRSETEEMLGSKTCDDTLSQIFPFIAL